DRLYVDFASAGKTDEDMEATAAVVQTVSQATFDFDVLMVTGDGSAGEWSYLYNPRTIDELTQGGQITVSEVWDAAEQGFDTIHRCCRRRRLTQTKPASGDANPAGSTSRRRHHRRRRRPWHRGGSSLRRSRRSHRSHRHRPSRSCADCWPMP